ncbi:MAG: pyrroline-5-carboxylate reductase [Spirochaetales bacterium]|nr:pyrroline-5-carboxylate reductase [Spirochaetales bacterium]
MSNVGFIGYGNMGQAMAVGLHHALPDWNIGVFDIDARKASGASSECGATVFTSYPSLREYADILVLAVKPQYLAATAQAAGGAFKEAQIISLLAGTGIDRISEAFETSQVVRFMPNLAAGIGKAVTAVAYGPSAQPAFREEALTAAQACGTAVVLDEALFGAFTGLSGSGIAYVFQILHAFALGGAKRGIPYQTSLEIALGTVQGAAGLLSASGEHPVSALSRVISPGGTTIEGIAKLEETGLTAAIIQAVEAAALRADELEGKNTTTRKTNA